MNQWQDEARKLLAHAHEDIEAAEGDFDAAFDIAVQVMVDAVKLAPREVKQEFLDLMTRAFILHHHGAL